jgi:hypothetical protein
VKTGAFSAPLLMLIANSKQYVPHVINCIIDSLILFSFAKFSTIAIGPAVDFYLSSQLSRQKMKIGLFAIRSTPHNA